MRRVYETRHRTAVMLSFSLSGNPAEYRHGGVVMNLLVVPGRLVKFGIQVDY